MENARFPGRWEKNFPVQRLNTWRIGGTAEYVYWPSDTAALSAFLQWSHAQAYPVRLIGRGSNILMPDGYLAGVLVVTTALDGIEWLPDGVRAETGYALPRLARQAAERGLKGLEFAWGIPGTVGAATILNAGAHGADFGSLVREAHVLSLRAAGYVVEKVPAAEITFAYRDSSLKTAGQWILAVDLTLAPGADPETLKRQGREYVARRRQAYPLELPNAGSVFRNPPLDTAGRLIEAAGWKGYRCGDAQVSAKHANFIVNLGGATAADVRTLIADIRADVYQKFGVDLSPEVVIWNENEEELPLI